MPTLEFDIAPPYDFELSLKFCQRSRFEIVDQTGPGCLRRIIIIDDRPVFIKVGVAGDWEAPKGKLTWSFPSPGKIPRERILASVRKILGTQINPGQFYELAERDRCMRDIAAKLRGLKPILTPTSFEAAAWAIMGQQVNLNFAYTLKMRLVKKYGKRFEIEGQRYYSFPEPGQLARARINTLRGMQFSQRKAEYISGLSRVLIEEGNFLENLASMEYEAAVEKLMSIRGLGIWSANYILMRGVGHTDCLPLGDSGLHRAVKIVYGLSQLPDNEIVAKFAEPFRPYRSLFTLYLWYNLMEVPEGGNKP